MAGVELACVSETTNTSDGYAVTVLEPCFNLLEYGAASSTLLLADAKVDKI